MNTEFKNHVTGAAFSLTISKGQIKMLKWVYDEDREGIISDGRFVMYLQGLERRGLVVHDKNYNPMSEKSSWSVTQAGILTVKLLVLAGFYEENK